MSRSDLESVREAFARWHTGDYDALTDFLVANSTVEVEIRSRFGEVSGQSYRGHDGVRGWLADIRDSFEHFEPWIDDAREAKGNRVVATGGIRCRMHGSEAEMNVPMGWIYEFRDGRLDRMLFFASPAEALEAAGLSEAAER